MDQELKLYTLDEVAELVNITRRTLYKHIEEGKLKATKVGGRWRVSDSNLRKYINGED